jgi:preprotein translocase subunit YajC
VQVNAAAVAAAQSGDAGSALSGLFPLLLIVLVVLFFMSSSRRRRRAQEQMQSGLLPGAMVVTTAGLYATVVELVDGGDVLLEVAPDVVCRFSRAAVVRVVTPPGSGEQSGPGDATSGGRDGGGVSSGDDDAGAPPGKEL